MEKTGPREHGTGQVSSNDKEVGLSTIEWTLIHLNAYREGWKSFILGIRDSPYV